MAQINKSSDYFNTVTYSGNGSTQSITGVNFQPDATWIKARSGTYGTENHNFYNAISGATKFLIPNGTSLEGTDANSLTSFDSDGFSVGTRTDINGSSSEYVAWNWLASNTTASNTQGDIASTVSANTTSGFSIVSYTGTGANATVGHGLGVAPKVVIYKNRSTTDYWYVYTDSSGWDQRLHLNTTASKATSTTLQSTAPSSSVVSIGTDPSVNGSGNDIIMYVMAEKKGFSKFGSYTGNGNADGSFIYLGFKPAFVINKIYSGTTSSWNIFDNKRDGFNDQNKQLYADLSNAEASGGKIDLLSNGFKVRSSSDEVNGSGYGYIYMAFAESPLVGTNNTPATAR